jgi:hypothetical protein
MPLAVEHSEEDVERVLFERQEVVTGREVFMMCRESDV